MLAAHNHRMWEKTCNAQGTDSRLYIRYKDTHYTLQSSQVKRTHQESINAFIIRKLNPLLVVDFRLISAFLHA